MTVKSGQSVPLMDVGEFHVRVTLRIGDLVFAGEDAVFVCKCIGRHCP